MRSLEQIDRWLAERIRTWTGKVPGAAPASRELLEVRRDILEDVRDRIEPAGQGRSVFPYSAIYIALAVDTAEQRAACLAAFGGNALEREIRELLREGACTTPSGFSVRMDVVDDPDLARSERPFIITYDLNASARSHTEPAVASPSAPAAKTTAQQPVASLQVLEGEAEQTLHTVRLSRFNIGRLREVVRPGEGLRRRNDLAFADSETTVSREHASIRWDAANGHYRVYDNNSQRGTAVFREGRRIDVPRGAVAGVPLRDGDEIHFGRARVLFHIG